MWIININKYKKNICECPAREEILPSNGSQIVEQANFTYSPLGKALEKQTEKQTDALKFLNLSNKAGELKRIKGIFPKNLLSDY